MMSKPSRIAVALSFLSLVLTGCGGGSSGPDPVLRSVTISWSANRETGVNRAGGGYTVSISGQSPINVPYVSGPLAPTSVTTSLLSGTYTVTVRGYSTLNSAGSPAILTVNVPF